MKETKSEREKITEKLDELSNDEFPGRYLVKESYDLISEAIEKGVPIPENLNKYITKKQKSAWNNATWLVYLLFVLVFMCNTQQSHASTLEAVTVTEIPKHKYKNDNVRKYHKDNNKRFQCTACPKRKFLGIFNRK